MLVTLWAGFFQAEIPQVASGLKGLKEVGNNNCFKMKLQHEESWWDGCESVH